MLGENAGKMWLGCAENAWRVAGSHVRWAIMWLGQVLGLFAGCAVLLGTSLAQAQCAKDTDCKGERVCEQGKCIEPVAAVPPAAPQAPAVPPAAPEPVPAVAPSAPPQPTTPKPKMRRHSTGMMVGGIVMVALAPPALIVAGFSGLLKLGCNVGDENSDRHCDDSYDPVIYGSLLSAVVLVAVGVPLLVVGAKREPDETTATVSPFLAPGGAGLGVRVDL